VVFTLPGCHWICRRDPTNQSEPDYYCKVPLMNGTCDQQCIDCQHSLNSLIAPPTFGYYIQPCQDGIGHAYAPCDPPPDPNAVFTGNSPSIGDSKGCPWDCKKPGFQLLRGSCVACFRTGTCAPGEVLQPCGLQFYCAPCTLVKDPHLLQPMQVFAFFLLAGSFLNPLENRCGTAPTPFSTASRAARRATPSPYSKTTTAASVTSALSQTALSMRRGSSARATMTRTADHAPPSPFRTIRSFTALGSALPAAHRATPRRIGRANCAPNRYAGQGCSSAPIATPLRTGNACPRASRVPLLRLAPCFFRDAKPPASADGCTSATPTAHVCRATSPAAPWGTRASAPGASCNAPCASGLSTGPRPSLDPETAPWSVPPTTPRDSTIPRRSSVFFLWRHPSPSSRALLLLALPWPLWPGGSTSPIPMRACRAVFLRAQCPIHST